MPLALGLLWLSACLLASSADVTKPTAREAYVREIEAWQHARMQELLAADGWLTLVGLFWLDEGNNTFGADPGNKLVFPADDVPPFAGIFKARGAQVDVVVNEGVTITHEGKPVTSMHLLSDAHEEPTVLKHKSLSFYIISRGDRVAVRLHDQTSRLRSEFKEIPTFEVDRAWRMPAKWAPHSPAKELTMPTAVGTVRKALLVGSVVFTRNGHTYRLDAVESDESDLLFIVFADTSNGQETYEAGRFLFVPRPNKGKLVLDFNKAQNPPCAFTPHATCPLPPSQNRLPFAVRAGEKKVAPASR